MARRKGQTYNPEQKAKVVLELLKEEKTLRELATQYKVTPKTIGNWKKEFLTNASKAFESDNNAKENKEKIQKLKEENDALAKALGKTTVERDWAVKSLDLSKRQSLVDSKLTILSKTRQAKLLGINRTTLYYKPIPFSNTNLKILDQIDKIYTDNPEYGYRMIYRQLLENGYTIGHNRVLKYMRMIGIQALYQYKKTLA